MTSYESPADVVLGEDAVVIRGTGPEPRHTPTYSSPAMYVDIVSQDGATISYRSDSGNGIVTLRDRSSLKQFLDNTPGVLYIDMTALSHHVWAPILRMALIQQRATRVLYIEPEGYVRSPNGVEGEIFDLSDRIQGLSAIPGFVSFSDDFEDRSCFVPMIGFEGKRTAYVLEQVQPQGRSIYPIIGMPGFRLEFPFYTVQSNLRILRETQAWRNVKYAAANNPFSVFETLSEIQDANPQSLLKIAPIGTKPHALGAFLFPLKTRKAVEFVYDFPIRKTNRTVGIGKVFVYRVSEFMS